MKRTRIPHWRLAQLARSLGTWGREPVLLDGALFDGRAGRIEHLVHEVAHAVSTGVRVSTRSKQLLSARVTWQISLMSETRAECNEALCLAAEEIILPQLGLSPRNLRERLYASLVSQGIPTELLSTFSGTDAARSLAERTLRALERAISSPHDTRPTRLLPPPRPQL